MVDELKEQMNQQPVPTATSQSLLPLPVTGTRTTRLEVKDGTKYLVEALILMMAVVRKVVGTAALSTMAQEVERWKRREASS